MLERLNEVEKRFDVIEADLMDTSVMADIEKYTALLRMNVKSDFGAVTGVVWEVLPCRTYHDEHAWEPHLLEEGEEYDRISAFLRGETVSPEG